MACYGDDAQAAAVADFALDALAARRAWLLRDPDGDFTVALEANAPRGLSGKNENPLAELLGKADIGWTIGRGPFVVNGASTGLNISATLNGSLRVTGNSLGVTGAVRMALSVTSTWLRRSSASARRCVANRVITS